MEEPVFEEVPATTTTFLRPAPPPPLPRPTTTLVAPPLSTTTLVTQPTTTFVTQPTTTLVQPPEIHYIPIFEGAQQHVVVPYGHPFWNDAYRDYHGSSPPTSYRGSVSFAPDHPSYDYVKSHKNKQSSVFGGVKYSPTYSLKPKARDVSLIKFTKNVHAGPKVPKQKIPKSERPVKPPKGEKQHMFQEPPPQHAAVEPAKEHRAGKTKREKEPKPAGPVKVPHQTTHVPAQKKEKRSKVTSVHPEKPPGLEHHQMEPKVEHHAHATQTEAKPHEHAAETKHQQRAAKTKRQEHAAKPKTLQPPKVRHVPKEKPAHAQERSGRSHSSSKQKGARSRSRERSSSRGKTRSSRSKGSQHVHVHVHVPQKSGSMIEEELVGARAKKRTQKKETKGRGKTGTTHRGERTRRRAAERHIRKDKRRRHARIQTLIGPQIEMSSDTVAALTRLSSHYRGFVSTHTKPAAFFEAMEHAADSPTEIDTSDISFGAHRNILSSHYRDRSLILAIKTGGKSYRMVADPTPLLHENLVKYHFSPAEVINLASNARFSIKMYQEGDRDDIFQHADVFHPPASHVKKGVTKSTSGKLFHVYYPLYDEAYRHVYVQHNIPTPHAVFSVRSRGEDNPYEVEAISILLDMSTKAHSHTHLAGYPSMSSMPMDQHGRSFAGFAHENVDHTHDIHEALKNNAEGTDIELVTTADSRLKTPSEWFYWGEGTSAVVSYAIIKLLADNKDLDGLDNPVFLSDVMSKDKRGKNVLKRIATIYKEYYQERKPADSNEFSPLAPTLRQLLTHTSGLLSTATTSCEDVIALYKETIAFHRQRLANVALPARTQQEEAESKEGKAGAAKEFTPERIYKSLEQAVLEKLTSVSLSEPNAVIGENINWVDSVLLSMFLYRYLSSKELPSHAVNGILNELNVAIQLYWDIEVDEFGRDVSSNCDPFGFMSCASSTKLSAVSYIQRMAAEMVHLDVNESPFAIQMSNPIRVKGDKRKIVHNIGWKEERLDSSKTLVYVRSANASSVQNHVMFLIPELHFWGIMISATESSNMLLSRIKDVFADIPPEDLPTTPMAFHSRKANPLENSRFVLCLSDLVEDPPVDLTKVLPPLDTEYILPFTSTGASEFLTAHIVLRKKKSNQLRIEISYGGRDKVVDTLSIVFIPRRHGFFRVMPDGTIGHEVTITSECVGFHPQVIFINKTLIMPSIEEYRETTKQIVEKARESIYGGDLEVLASSIGGSIPMAMFTSPEAAIIAGEMDDESGSIGEDAGSPDSNIGPRMGGGGFGGGGRSFGGGRGRSFGGGSGARPSGRPHGRPGGSRPRTGGSRPSGRSRMGGSRFGGSRSSGRSGSSGHGSGSGRTRGQMGQHTRSFSHPSYGNVYFYPGFGWGYYPYGYFVPLSYGLLFGSALGYGLAGAAYGPYGYPYYGYGYNY